MNLYPASIVRLAILKRQFSPRILHFQGFCDWLALVPSWNRQVRFLSPAAQLSWSHVVVHPPPTSTQSYPSPDCVTGQESHVSDPQGNLDTLLMVEPSSKRSCHPGGPIDLYRDRIRSGVLKKDEHQVKMVQKLQALYEHLGDYDPPRVDSNPVSASQGHGWLSKLWGPTSGDGSHGVPANVPKGLYLFGSVGTGKSMLMDMLYESLPNLKNPGLTYRRIHFHQFMFEVHKQNHDQSKPSSAGQVFAQQDRLVSIARSIAQRSRILCFDEFQVTDIVDAMILKRLLEVLVANGVVCVMTSNRHPDELYRNGIQRSSFMPCIQLIKECFQVEDLDSRVDYRKLPNSVSKVFFSPISATNSLEFEKMFDALTDDQPILTDRKLKIWGRELAVPKSTESVAWFDFAQLCGGNLGASDYLEIVKKFPIIFLNQVPKLNLSQRDLARRLILFLDTAYESKTKLFALSEVPITQVFSNDPPPAGSLEPMTAEMRRALDDLGLDINTCGSSSLFTGEEEVFAWARAVSRLREMETLNWSINQSNFSAPFKKPPCQMNIHLNKVVGVSDLVKGMEGDSSSLLSGH